jgi:hypothetical protein
MEDAEFRAQLLGFQEGSLLEICRNRGEAYSLQGRGGGRDCCPQTLASPHWWAGSGPRGDSLKARETWVPASWGSPRPQHRWASLGAPAPPEAAVWVGVPLGIRELLAAPTEILPLTANARQGRLYGNLRVERLACAGPLWAHCWRHFWSLPSSHFGSLALFEAMALSVQGSWWGSAASESLARLGP